MSSTTRWLVHAAATLALGALLAAPAHAQSEPAPLAPVPEVCGERVTLEGSAPIPFSAACLQAAITVGEGYRFRTEQMGGPTQVVAWRMTSSGDEGLGMDEQVFDEAGNAMGPPESAVYPWLELQSHATYPAATTTIEETTVEVGAGRFEGWRYRVPGDDGTVTDVWFARQLPGPPVLLTVTAGDQTVFRLELIEHTESP